MDIHQKKTSFERLKELKERLEGLEISVAKTAEGTFTAFTHVEPLFWFERQNEEELKRLVEQTLISYIKTFYGDESTLVQLTKSETHKRLPVQQLTTLERLYPTINRRQTLNKQPVPV